MSYAIDADGETFRIGDRVWDAINKCHGRVCKIVCDRVVEVRDEINEVYVVTVNYLEKKDS